MSSVHSFRMQHISAQNLSVSLGSLCVCLTQPRLRMTSELVICVVVVGRMVIIAYCLVGFAIKMFVLWSHYFRIFYLLFLL